MLNREHFLTKNTFIYMFLSTYIFLYILPSFINWLSSDIWFNNRNQSLRKKSPYSELFWSAFFTQFPAFELNTERYSVSLRVQFECEKMREKMPTRITPNTYTFYAVN